jgi:hypothetical protein
MNKTINSKLAILQTAHLVYTGVDSLRSLFLIATKKSREGRGRGYLPYSHCFSFLAAGYGMIFICSVVRTSTNSNISRNPGRFLPERRSPNSPLIQRPMFSFQARGVLSGWLPRLPFPAISIFCWVLDLSLIPSIFLESSSQRFVTALSIFHSSRTTQGPPSRMSR